MDNKLDVSASYPNGETSYNIGKDTTSREIVEIEGIDEEVFRMQNMHLSAGHVNAIEYCTTMMGFPKLDELLTAFDQKNNSLGNSQINDLGSLNTMLAIAPTVPNRDI